MAGMLYYPNTLFLYSTLVPIGISSFYFHSTLSLFGQLLDEGCIMISIICTLRHINVKIYQFCNRELLNIVNIIQILSMFVCPQYNRFILFFYGVWCWRIVDHIKKTCNETYYYISLTQLSFLISVISWLIDYIFCVKNINFHALWHIFIGFVGYFLFKAIDIYNKFYIPN